MGHYYEPTKKVDLTEYVIRKADQGYNPDFVRGVISTMLYTHLWPTGDGEMPHTSGEMANEIDDAIDTVGKTDSVEVVTARHAFIRDRALRALRGLGDTGKAVFETLSKAGITGDRGNCQTCPIAVYLKAGFPNAAIHVLELSAQIDGAYVDLPSAVSDFIRTFDSCGYVVPGRAGL